MVDVRRDGESRWDAGGIFDRNRFCDGTAV